MLTQSSSLVGTWIMTTPCSSNSQKTTRTVLLSLFLMTLVHGFISVSPPSLLSLHQEQLRQHDSALFSASVADTTKTNDRNNNNNDANNVMIQPPQRRVRRRDRFLNKLGFKRLSQDQRTIREMEKRRATKPRIRITAAADIEAYFQDTAQQFRKVDTASTATENDAIDYSALLDALDVRGDTQVIGSPDRPDYVHPVVQMVHDRSRRRQEAETTSQQQRPDDGAKIALAIEGGGMRGCVSAGAICALHHLNLTHAIDVVYGSSAGTIIGSYLITEQLPWFGPELYYDALTTAGREFIDTRRVLRALGFGLLDPRLLKDVLTRPAQGKPVLNLSFLLKKTLQERKPLDWDKFVQKQSRIPLKVVVSDLKSERSRVLDMENGYFTSLSELANCMHASCLLPGIAGPLMNMDMDAVMNPDSSKQPREKYVVGNNLPMDQYHPMADALIYEPLPFRSAIAEGATHVIVVRSRPDGVDVSGKPSLFESLIFRRFFLRKNRLPRIFQHMKRQYHKKIYARDVLRLNEEAYSTRDYRDTSQPHLMTIAIPPGSPEVTKLELRREAIFEGMRRGFARAYDCLVEDPRERGRGEQVAKEFFPDEIMHYDPLAIDSKYESAFEYYLRTKQSGEQLY